MINLRISCNYSPISPYCRNENLIGKYFTKTIPISQYRKFGDGDILINVSDEELIEILEEGEDDDR